MIKQNPQQDIIRLKLSTQALPHITLSDMPVFLPGWVWLAGAGPGDVGLLTLHAVNALQQADILIYDALVSEDILALAPATCQKIYAGKRGGKPSWKQQDISDKIIHYARAQKRVLRLKGGDPFIFGRGGEEAEALFKADINFRIIPGISAGIGGLAYAGIPATHRDINHGVSFVTGHMADDETYARVDWDALAKATPVIVLYMAMGKLDKIAHRLIAAGRDADEPVAFITHATTPLQNVLETTLAKAHYDAQAAQLEPPAIIVIGAVVNLRKMLSWFA